MKEGEKMEELEKRIGYCFQNKELLKNALTHTSYAYENKVKSNERLLAVNIYLKILTMCQKEK